MSSVDVDRRLPARADPLWPGAGAGDSSGSRGADALSFSEALGTSSVVFATFDDDDTLSVAHATGTIARTKSALQLRVPLVMGVCTIRDLGREMRAPRNAATKIRARPSRMSAPMITSEHR